MLPARSVPRFLHIQTEIDLVREHLHMTLWLHTATHYTECFPRFTILHNETRNDGVKRTLGRRVNVCVIGIHRKKLAAILKHESKSGHDDPAAHPAIIALNK